MSDVKDSRLPERFNRALRELNLSGRERIFEFGCGRGALAVELARRIPHGDYLGLDRSTTAIDIARRRAASAGLTDRADFFVGDETDLTRLSSTFNLVICVNVGMLANPAKSLVVGRLMGIIHRVGALRVFYEAPVTQRARAYLDGVVDNLLDYGVEPAQAIQEETWVSIHVPLHRSASGIDSTQRPT